MGKLLFIVIISLLYLCCTQTINAQGIFPEDNGSVLKGVTEFSLLAIVPIWKNVEIDRDSVESKLNSDFQQMLRGTGFNIINNASNKLKCSVYARQRENNIVYHTTIEFYKKELGLHKLLWRTSTMEYTQVRFFSSKHLAQDCFLLFSKEWGKHNPSQLYR